MVCEFEPAFLATVRPLCERRDYPALLAILRENWPPRRLIELLKSAIGEVTATAAACLGYTGTILHTRHLTPLLAHDDERVAESAEEALWNIWMRAGGGVAREQLSAAIDHIRNEAYEPALIHLRVLIAREPTFAEAHHQRAIALHAQDRLDEAESAYRETLRLNPEHFAAWAGLGHVHAQRSELGEALDAYRNSVRVNPRQSDLREILPQLESAVRRRNVA